MIYANCKWCHGRGCVFCPREAEKARERAMQPIFTARRDNPEEMQELKRVMGKDAIDHAFGPEGSGVQEIEFNAGVAMLLRQLRQPRKKDDNEQNDQKE